MLNLVKTMHNATSFPKSNVSDLSSAEISVELDRLAKIIVFKVLRNTLRRTRERGAGEVAQVKRTRCSRRGSESDSHHSVLGSQLQLLGYARPLALEVIVFTCAYTPTDSHIYIPL